MHDSFVKNNEIVSISSASKKRAFFASIYFSCQYFQGPEPDLNTMLLFGRQSFIYILHREKCNDGRCSTYLPTYHMKTEE